MIEEFDKVKIKQSGIVGTVVDIYTVRGKTFYTVESESKGASGYELFRCTKDEIKKL